MINERALLLGRKKSIIREIFEYSKKRASEIGCENVYDFSLGNPSVNPPDEVSKTLIDLIKNNNPTSLHGYTSAQGDLNVRKAIANRLNSKFGVNINENNIYMTCGAAASLTISLKALFNDGDECIVFAPFFTEYKVFVENAGGKIVISNPDTKNFQINVEDFSNKITKKTKAIILNSPNNPSGVVYSKNTIEKVCKVLKDKQKEYGTDIYLISDEPYRELIYGDVEVPYLMNFYDNTIVCYSYSKSLSLPGERIGYIAVSPKCKDCLDVYSAVCGAGRSLGYVCAPSLFQKVIEKCVDVSVDINPYINNRNLLFDSLSSFGYDCVRPDGAFYLFVKSPDGDAFSFYEKAKKYDILVVPCDDFGIKGYVRIAYCVPYERIKNSLRVFEQLAYDYKIR